MEFKDLAWAAFLAYYIFAEDEDYQGVMGSRQTKLLRSKPEKVPFRDYKGLVVQKYLNKWGSCRVRNISSVARKIRNELTNSITDFRRLRKKDILTFDFKDKEVCNSVERIYDRMHRKKYIGPTIASKIMHLINSSLFLPWDTFMRRDFCKKKGLPKSRDDGQTYVRFLMEQQSMAKEVVTDFSRRFKKKARLGPAVYLSNQLDYSPPKKLTKFIDEYNWITLSHLQDESLIPPFWFPDL